MLNTSRNENNMAVAAPRADAIMIHRREFEPSEDLAVLAHELRTPLAAIRLLSEVLVQRRCDRARVQGLVDQLHSISATLGDTLESVLDARRVQNGSIHWGPCDLEEQALQAVETVRPLVGSLPVRLAGPVGHALPMRGDAGALRRIMVNLLTNALRSVAQGGILLTLDSFRRRHAWNLVTVTDTGSGIDPATLACLRTCGGGASSVHGTGLGLRIARTIAAAHGGVLEIETTSGRGTTVRALLRADLAGPRARQIGPRGIRVRAQTSL